MLSLEQVSVTIGHQQILKELSFDIETGCFVTIVGPSGSGKSTLLRLINGLISPTTGKLTYQEQDIVQWDPKQLRQEIGMAFQKPYLFGETVEDNLTFPYRTHKKDVDWEEIHQLLDELNLPQQILKKKKKDLSGGEQQRICFIRSLLLKPKVLLLDEVTASLDPENTNLVESYLKKLYKKNKTIIMVTHNLTQAERLGQYTVFLRQGELVKYMPTAELFSQEDVEFETFQNGRKKGEEQ